MYKHLITYRHYIDMTPTSSISPVKKIDIDIDERISYDGPGVWKIKCKNFISQKTGINPSQVLDDGHLRIDYIGLSEQVENKPKPTITTSRNERHTKSIEEYTSDIDDEERERIIAKYNENVRKTAEARALLIELKPSLEKLRPSLEYNFKNGRNSNGIPYKVGSEEWIKWQKEYAPPPTYKLKWKSKSFKNPYIVVTGFILFLANWLMLKDLFEYDFEYIIELINFRILFVVNFIILIPLLASSLSIKKEQIVLDNTIDHDHEYK
jgi:hypothetical protein